MSTSTVSTQWPSFAIPSDIKNLVALLYSLVESKASTVGKQLVEDVFTPDGKFLTPHSTAAGSAGQFSHLRSRSSHLSLAIFKRNSSHLR